MSPLPTANSANSAALRTSLAALFSLPKQPA